MSSLWALCLWLFLDGATFSFATTPLLLQYSKDHSPWAVALAGGAASALGSVVQFLVLRWLLDTREPGPPEGRLARSAPGHLWRHLVAGYRHVLHRFAPSQEKLQETIRKNPSASFLAIFAARATPMPDAPVKLVAAAARYPVPLYFLAVLGGALPYYLALALVGRAVRVPTWVILVALAGVAIGVLLDRWRRRGAT